MGGREGGRKGGWEEWRVGGREGRRKGGWEEGRVGGREGGRITIQDYMSDIMTITSPNCYKDLGAGLIG